MSQMQLHIFSWLVCVDPALVPPAGGALPPFSESKFSSTSQVVTLQLFKQITFSCGGPCSSQCGHHNDQVHFDFWFLKNKSVNSDWILN